MCVGVCGTLTDVALDWVLALLLAPLLESLLEVWGEGDTRGTVRKRENNDGEVEGGVG